MLSQDQMIKIIEVANQAKDVAEYDLANAAFAVLLDTYFDGQRFDTETLDGLWLEWETQDEEGQMDAEIYYDLLSVCMLDTDGPRGVCIPVPILDSFSALTALKSAAIVEREQHGREQREADAGEVDGLWQRLLAAVEHTDTIDRALTHLAADEDEDDHPAVVTTGENGGTVICYDPRTRSERIRSRLSGDLSAVVLEPFEFFEPNPN